MLYSGIRPEHIVVSFFAGVIACEVRRGDTLFMILQSELAKPSLRQATTNFGLRQLFSFHLTVYFTPRCRVFQSADVSKCAGDHHINTTRGIAGGYGDNTSGEHSAADGTLPIYTFGRIYARRGPETKLIVTDAPGRYHQYR